MTVIRSILRSDSVFALVIIIPTLAFAGLFGTVEYIILKGF